MVKISPVDCRVPEHLPGWLMLSGTVLRLCRSYSSSGEERPGCSGTGKPVSKQLNSFNALFLTLPLPNIQGKCRRGLVQRIYVASNVQTKKLLSLAF
jgi:hypothetical protein